MYIRIYVLTHLFLSDKITGSALANNCCSLCLALKRTASKASTAASKFPASSVAEDCNVCRINEYIGKPRRKCNGIRAALIHFSEQDKIFSLIVRTY